MILRNTSGLKKYSKAVQVMHPLTMHPGSVETLYPVHSMTPIHPQRTCV